MIKTVIRLAQLVSKSKKISNLLKSVSEPAYYKNNLFFIYVLLERLYLIKYFCYAKISRLIN